MLGLFMENGPLRITKGSGADDYKISAADQSWADDYNVIYLDQPVNTGFSYAKTSNTDQKVGAKEFIEFMVQFYELYPEFKTRDFHLNGESYAGKYLSLFTYTILEYNKDEFVTPIPLKTTMVFDPFPTPGVQRVNMHVVPRALNIIDDTNLNQVAVLEQHCQELQSDNFTASYEMCGEVMTYMQNVSGKMFKFNAEKFNYDFVPLDRPIKDCLTKSLKKEELFKALHVEDSFKRPVFDWHSDSAALGYSNFDGMTSYAKYWEYLVENEFPVMIAAGELDDLDGPVG